MTILLGSLFAGCLSIPDGDGEPYIVFESKTSGDVFTLTVTDAQDVDWADVVADGCQGALPNGTVAVGQQIGLCSVFADVIVYHQPTATVFFERSADDDAVREPITWLVPMRGNRFVDGSITIQLGDTVRWVHEDGVTPHDVQSTGDQEFQFYSGDMYQFTPLFPSRFEVTFTELGDFDYVCTYHRGTMSDTIKVVERAATE